MPSIPPVRPRDGVPSLKPLAQQVLVLTGATGSAGTAVARKAARQGAAVVIADTDGNALHRLAQDIESLSDSTFSLPLTSYDDKELQRLAEAALSRFGRIDSWVDSLEGRWEASACGPKAGAPAEETFSLNALLACSRVAQEAVDNGGAMVIIAVPDPSGETLSTLDGRMLDQLGIQCCAMRNGFAQLPSPVSLTLIRPAPADGAFGSPVWKGRGHDGQDCPACPTEAVAAAALYAVQHPARDVYVGIAAAPANLHYTPCAASSNILPLSSSMRRGRQSDRPMR